MKRIALVVLATVPALAGAAELSREQQAAVNAVGFRLTTAYHCAAVTGDIAAYEAARANTQAALDAASVTSPTADEMIAVVEAGDRGNVPPAITPQLCRDLLAGLE